MVYKIRRGIDLAFSFIYKEIMKIKILKQTFVKGELAEAGKVVEVSEQDSNVLIGGGHAIAVAEDMKKPENKAVKKKSIFSRKKK